MSARSEILGRIRRATSGASPNRETDYASIPRRYIQESSLGHEETVDLFIDRLHDYDAIVHRCDVAGISATIAEVLSTRGKRGLLVPAELPSDWLPPNFTFVPDNSLSYNAIDRSEGVLTGCAVAIATTGTIVLRHSPADGRRALTLIPDFHLCVVPENRLVATVPEAIHVMSKFGSDPLTTVSGPSATSDIEMTRIKGVHGPRTLEVILVRER